MEVSVNESRLGELERAIAFALNKVRELAEENALPPVLQALTAIAPPRGMRADVELQPYTDHARDDDWQNQRWDPRNGEVAIGYEPMRADDGREERRFEPEERVAPPDPEVAVRDVVRVVARAEGDPAFKFLALKFLRDQLLPRHVEWAAAQNEAQIQINRAIDAGVLVTSKVENPRMPQYPVTAVALNRDHDVVKEILNAPASAAPAEEEAAPDAPPV
jgi:hypothetical protein